MEQWLKKYWWSLPLIWYAMFAIGTAGSSGAHPVPGYIPPPGAALPITKHSDGHYYDANGVFIS